MNEFIITNKKYLTILVLGLVMLTVPLFLKSSNNSYDKSCEQRFIGVMQNAKGVGKIEIMTGTTKDGQISGVVIVAQGAEDITIRKQIADAACAAFDVQPHKIQIFAYNGRSNLNENK